MEPLVVCLLIVKGDSRRLPKKNLLPFHGEPMFIRNVRKCLNLFDHVYVSSESEDVLMLAAEAGAKPIARPKDLCGEVPDIPVYLHAWKHMPPILGLVTVHADTPLVDPQIIATTRDLIYAGVNEVITGHPITPERRYKDQHSKIYGSVRGLSVTRLVTYGDPYRPKPDVIIIDPSIEVEDQTSYEKALWLSRPQ